MAQVTISIFTHPHTPTPFYFNFVTKLNWLQMRKDGIFIDSRIIIAGFDDSSSTGGFSIAAGNSFTDPIYSPVHLLRFDLSNAVQFSDVFVCDKQDWKVGASRWIRTELMTKVFRLGRVKQLKKRMQVAEKPILCLRPGMHQICAAKLPIGTNGNSQIPSGSSRHGETTQAK